MMVSEGQPVVGLHIRADPHVSYSRPAPNSDITWVTRDTTWVTRDFACVTRDITSRNPFLHRSAPSCMR
jgi:hypothetical protein